MKYYFISSSQRYDVISIYRIYITSFIYLGYKWHIVQIYSGVKMIQLIFDKLIIHMTVSTFYKTYITCRSVIHYTDGML